MGWNRKCLSLDLATYEDLIVQVFSPLFLLSQVKRVDYKVDNMEGYAQWSLTRSCETVKYKKNNENVEYLTHHCINNFIIMIEETTKPKI